MKICREYGALIVYDTAEIMNTRYDGQITFGMYGSFGDFTAVSHNGNNIFKVVLSFIDIVV